VKPTTGGLTMKFRKRSTLKHIIFELESCSKQGESAVEHVRRIWTRIARNRNLNMRFHAALRQFMKPRGLTMVPAEEQEKADIVFRVKSIGASAENEEVQYYKFIEALPTPSMPTKKKFMKRIGDLVFTIEAAGDETGEKFFSAFRDKWYYLQQYQDPLRHVFNRIRAAANHGGLILEPTLPGEGDVTVTLVKGGTQINLQCFNVKLIEK